MVKKRTTLIVEKDVWKKTKLYCVENDIEISSLIEKLLIQYLTNLKNKEARVKNEPIPAS
jgi:hypothetical protein